MAPSGQRPPAPLTPPGIAILALLWRQPMHPYEMRHRIRVQEIDRVMKVTHGTLYSTVDRLAAAGLIQPVETSREGRRPERTGAIQVANACCRSMSRVIKKNDPDDPVRARVRVSKMIREPASRGALQS